MKIQNSNTNTQTPSKGRWIILENLATLIFRAPGNKLSKMRKHYPKPIRTRVVDLHFNLLST